MEDILITFQPRGKNVDNCPPYKNKLLSQPFVILR